jgi:AcrR family transcriptional regulator
VEIAAAGLGASTACIARRADVAAGTLFTYFASKDELLNALYLELKAEVCARVNAGFPEKGSLEQRARHIWTAYLDWALQAPEKRKVSVQLNVSDVITAATRAKAAQGRELIDGTLAALDERSAGRGLPKGFSGAVMMAMQEALLELLGKRPRPKPPQRTELADRMFAAYWRAVR